MGRIKTQLIKRATLDLVRDHRQLFNKSFEKNKEAVDKILDIPSKKLRNTIAGYVTRLVNKKKD